jgi:hypothetical protein
MSLIVCGTGHRPSVNNCTKNARRALNNFLKLEPAISYGITGMADGWDTTLAKAFLYYKIPLHCYVPYIGQKLTSPDYEGILEKADKIVYCSEKYYSGVFLERDRQMVDVSQLVLAFWNPGILNGGTYYTVNYAKKNKVPVINFF